MSPLLVRVYTAFSLSTFRGEVQARDAGPAAEREAVGCYGVLRAEVKRLEVERDILKKATAFFAALSK